MYNGCFSLCEYIIFLPLECVGLNVLFYWSGVQISRLMRSRALIIMIIGSVQLS